MKVMVTGGAGFIGSHFVRYWLQHHPEDELVNFDALTYSGNLANLADVTNCPTTFIQGDIRDSQAVDQVMTGVDVVVHFAAETHVDRSILEPAAFVTTNVVGTQVLLDAALRHQVKRFHHVSTDEVFGSLELETTANSPKPPPMIPAVPTRPQGWIGSPGPGVWGNLWFALHHHQLLQQLWFAHVPGKILSLGNNESYRGQKGTAVR